MLFLFTLIGGLFVHQLEPGARSRLIEMGSPDNFFDFSLIVIVAFKSGTTWDPIAYDLGLSGAMLMTFLP